MSIRFNATNDIVGIASPSGLTMPVTFMCWAYQVTDRNAQGIIFVFTNSAASPTKIVSLYIDNDGQSLRRNIVPQSNASLSAALSVETWVHLAVTYDGTNYKFYLNGSLHATHTVSPDAFTLDLFAFGADGVGYLDGRIGAIKIWTAALSDAEVAAERDRLDAVRSSNLWAIYSTESATLLQDVSGNGRHMGMLGAGSVGYEDQPPGVTWGGSTDYPLSLDAGSYAITGNAVGLVAARLLPLDAGSYALTGNAVALTRGRILELDAGDYAVTGNDVTFVRGHVLALDAGGYTLTGNAAGLVRGHVLALDAGGYTLTGYDVALAHGRVVAAAAGSYSVAGNDVGLTVARVLPLDAGDYAVTGNDTNLTYTPAAGHALALDAGTYTLTGYAVGLAVARVLPLDAGSYAVAGQDADLTYSPAADYTLPLAAGSYTLTGYEATLTVARVLAFDAGMYTLTGEAIALMIARVLAFDAGSYAVAGHAVALNWSGEFVPPTPAARRMTVWAHSRGVQVSASERTVVIAGDQRTDSVGE